MQIGDLVSIEGAGAYCSGMSTKNYNSFPEAPEVLIDANDNIHLIRRYESPFPIAVIYIFSPPALVSVKFPTIILVTFLLCVVTIVTIIVWLLLLLLWYSLATF